MKTRKEAERIDLVCEGTVYEHELEGITEAEYQGRKVESVDPFRLPSGSDSLVSMLKTKGNVIKVQFGDPNMEIQRRDDPGRRASFRARHNCDQKKDKTTAGYWSCYQWRAGAKVDN